MMSEQFRKMEITTLGDGAVIERVNIEMAKVFANIIDINTDPTASREIHLKIKFKPSDDRLSCATSVSCSSKLCSMEQLVKRVYFGENGEAFERKEPIAEGLFSDVTIEENEEKHKKKGLKVC